MSVRAEGLCPRGWRSGQGLGNHADLPALGLSEEHSCLVSLMGVKTPPGRAAVRAEEIMCHKVPACQGSACSWCVPCVLVCVGVLSAWPKARLAAAHLWGQSGAWRTLAEGA